MITTSVSQLNCFIQFQYQHLFFFLFQFFHFSLLLVRALVYILWCSEMSPRVSLMPTFQPTAVQWIYGSSISLESSEVTSFFRTHVYIHFLLLEHNNWCLSFSVSCSGRARSSIWWVFWPVSSFVSGRLTYFGVVNISRHMMTMITISKGPFLKYKISVRKM